MIAAPEQITLTQWDARYKHLRRQGLSERFFGGPLSRHARRGDKRLLRLKLDNSPAALALWNLLLTENQRLHQSRAQGKKIIGAMKDLGTIPVLACGLDNLVTFYPDGAWWTPCLMEQDEGLFELAAQHGLDESFCPVRAMVGAFVNRQHFPIPDALVCSTGAICDDFSAVAQRLEQLGFPIHWWEIPRRRNPDPKEESVLLPCGRQSPRMLTDFVRQQLEGVKRLLEQVSGKPLTDDALARSIQRANHFRGLLAELRLLAYTSTPAPIGSLEMLIAEMLALHYCSDYLEAMLVVQGLLAEVQRRVAFGTGVLAADAVRVFWVNPPADIRVMNLLEESGGRVCGTDYMFTHTLEQIPERIDPMEAFARIALSDPMIGPTQQRAESICRQAVRFGAEGVVISRIAGASHCAAEGQIISQIVRDCLELPVVEIEVPTQSDAAEASIRTRLEALTENIKQRRLQ